METVTVKDKTFTISIPAEQLQARIAEVGAQLSKDLSGKNPLFVAVLNGSFMFAADLMRHITIPSEISFVRFSSYAGMESTGKVKELIGLSESLEGRTVVVVEDIIDSGLTMQQLLAQPEKVSVPLTIDYTCFNIPNDFIVGYGLDYDGYGRNLPAIYTVTE
ncbi:MAG: hypoxanthine phosphoribosyltransferase [Alloprevotella sp.]|nr:MAG: hypoxanthine phosphoribosyltransferase [Alloprevotella sp.]